MTRAPDPSGGDQGEQSEPEAPAAAPFLPSAPARIAGSVAAEHAARGADHLPTSNTRPDVPVGATTTTDPAAPHLPSAPATVAGSVATKESPVFDAKAMVESQKHYKPKPTYGAMPKATPESVEAARKLRAVAQRKRRRNKFIAWSVLTIMIGGVGAAGWFAYQAYQEDQDRKAAERAAREAEGVDEPFVPGALTPLGNQQQVIEGMEALNDTAQASGRGLLDSVDQARDVVADMNEQGGSPSGAPAAPAAPAAGPVALDDVLPATVVEHARQLDDAAGFERYVVDADDLIAADPAAYRDFVDVLRALPQAPPSSAGFAILPTIRRGEIGLGLQVVDGAVRHLVAVADAPPIAVDTAL